jgi:hypothetical protein
MTNSKNKNTDPTSAIVGHMGDALLHHYGENWPLRFMNNNLHLAMYALNKSSDIEPLPDAVLEAINLHFVLSEAIFKNRIEFVGTDDFAQQVVNSYK